MAGFRANKEIRPCSDHLSSACLFFETQVIVCKTTNYEDNRCLPFDSGELFLLKMGRTHLSCDYFGAAGLVSLYRLRPVCGRSGIDLCRLPVDSYLPALRTPREQSGHLDSDRVKQVKRAHGPVAAAGC